MANVYVKYAPVVYSKRCR